MKRSLRDLVLAAACLWGCAACSDDVADRLKGKWQLQTVEADGAAQRVDTVWYNFQSESLFMYQANYTLRVEQFLPFTDWSSGGRTFRVVHVDSRRLQLESNGRRYSFLKF